MACSGDIFLQRDSAWFAFAMNFDAARRLLPAKPEKDDTRKGARAHTSHLPIDIGHMDRNACRRGREHTHRIRLLLGRHVWRRARGSILNTVLAMHPQNVSLLGIDGCLLRARTLSGRRTRDGSSLS